VAPEATQDEVYAAVMADASIAKFVTGTPKKVILVKGRLMSVVV
jgi:leucyl-tRNA synthetase